jgi:uncharacterized damage-inducible protein DinB
MRHFRKNGAIGALLDEYEKTLDELKSVIRNLSKYELVTVVDSETNDPDCKSIQTILTHVVRSGYNYTIVIRKFLGEEVGYVDINPIESVEKYTLELNKMFAYCEQLFDDHPSLNIEEHDNSKKIHVRWEQNYDVEQLLEHAIVHVLRHRRQIEKFIIELRNQSPPAVIHK